MFKALLKKQLLELNMYYVMNTKTGKRRSSAGIAGMIVLFVFVFLAMAALFFVVAEAIAMQMLAPGTEQGMTDWLYFALMSVLVVLIGTFGSVFNTYAGIYRAKDNELLLSMPIRPSRILLVRMLGLYITSLTYCAIVWIPTMAAFGLTKEAGAGSLTMLFVVLLFLTLFVSVLSCLLGWLVALVSAKLRHKNIVTMLISVVVFGLYYYVCFQLNSLLSLFGLYRDQIGDAFKSWIYPVYLLGRGCCGHIPSLLIALLGIALLFLLCCFVMSKSFIRIVTMKKGEKKVAYKSTAVRAGGYKKALWMRELRHFTSSPTYMLNTGMGIVMMPVVAVLAYFNPDVVAMMREGLQEAGLLHALPIFLVTAVGWTMGNDAITAPSISLEGRGIWIMQSLPVPGWDVLRAKELLHVVLNTVPALISTVALGVMFQLESPDLLLACVVVFQNIILSADLGLVVGLKKANLNWTNEAAVIKQGMSAFIMLFGSWIWIGLLCGLYFLMPDFVRTNNYLLLVFCLYQILIVFLRRWLQHKGAKIFETLQ